MIYLFLLINLRALGFFAKISSPVDPFPITSSIFEDLYLPSFISSELVTSGLFNELILDFKDETCSTLVALPTY